MAAKPSRAEPLPAKSRKRRVERDALGTFEVPHDAYYGIHTYRALMSAGTYMHSLNRHLYYLRAMLKVKKAAARANRDARVLPRRIADAIETACDDILRDPLKYPKEFPVDALIGGGGIAINMNVNEVIANLGNELLGGTRGDYQPIDPKRHVNASQSTADVCHTAMRIAVILTWEGLHAKLDACGEDLRAKAKEFHPIRTLARTCLQDAGATSLGDLFGGYAAAIERRTGEIDRAVGALHQINLGGTVLGDGAGASPAYRRAVLRHLNRTVNEWDPRGHVTNVRHKFVLRENLFDAAQNCDDLGNVAAQVGLLAEVLIKIAQDLRLLASGPRGGFGEITMPAVIEGSSFYPGKINPVNAETLIQCCFQALGHELAARLALEHGELNLNVFESSAAINIVDAMNVLEGPLGEFWSMLRGITANKARCTQLASFARNGARKGGRTR
ncbi:MAG TPA: lyase family protein [Candidatus Binataceae bacterium]|nr:lyase family protein [Candidatus Binataceae bacterium]